MKKTAQLLLLVLILISNRTFPQNLLNDYPGIPIITRLPDWEWTQNHTDLVDSMKKAGVDFVTLMVEDSNFTPQMNFITAESLKVIPHKSRGLNYIRYYTDAKYSIWEAEGTPPEISEAMLEYSTKCEVIDSGYVSYVKVISDSADTTFEMIYGPYYDQQVYEITPADTFDFARYTTIFRLKLEKNENYPDTTSVENIFDPICKLQITQSYVSTSPDWNLPCTYLIKDSLITRGQFQQLNNFIDFSFNNYILDCDSCQSPPPSSPPPQHQIYATDNSVEDIDLDGLKKRHYIQFKVVWLGNPRYLLSVDKVTVYDDKGFELIEDDPLLAQTLIQDQIETLSPTYDSYLAGWLGIDEPVSIDNFAPIKKVIEILNNYSSNARPLWLALMGRWDGVWENRNNIFGTYHLSPWSEMKKRIGNMNIWQDAYYLDYPWNDTSCINCTEPWYGQNIRIAAELNYKQAQILNPNFGVSIQCGEIHIPGVAEQRNIWGYELLYETNLALLYGAKYIDLYTYFAMCDTDGYNCTGTIRGIVDSYRGNYYHTNKYDTLRYIINPRLKGLFGKTLKSVQPIEQHLAFNFQPIRYLNGFQIGALPKGELPDDNDFDLGFFGKDDKEYFMFIRRYYNTWTNPVFIDVDREHFEYNNIKVVDCVKDTSFTLGENEKIIFDGGIGDARLYGLMPVVKYGGTIAYTDTVTDEILKGPLTIASGATLYVNGEYYAYANITIEQGGSLVVLPGSSLYFYDSTSLFNKGNLIANGTAQDSILISFGWPNANKNNGIKLERSSTTNELTYCKITNAYHGIEIDSVTPTIEYNRIYGNYDGMYLLNSDYEFTTYEGTKIWHNTIHNNTDAGIRLIESSPWIAGNDISGNWAGVRCLVSSGAYFGEVGEPGCNGIAGNIYGVYSWGSNVLLGVESEPIVAGFNTIYNTQYDLIADHGSYIEAEYNCFPDFDESKFLRLDSSMIDASLEPNCMQIGWKVATNNGTPVKMLGKGTIPIEGENNLLKKAWKYFLAGKKYSARELCKEIITTNHNSKTAPLALDLLITTFSKSKDSIKLYLNSITSNNPQGYLFAYTKLKLADLVKDNYISKIDNVISTYSNTGINELALFKKFIYFFFEMKDKNQAIQVSQQMTSSIPNSELTKEVKSLLGNSVLPKKEENTTSVPKEYFLGNYPNPFNPVTTIRYSLPKAEKVNISVYDILGRKVKELVNEEKEAGRYEIQFNANNLASGCYFYRIITKDFVKTMKMLMLK